MQVAPDALTPVGNGIGGPVENCNIAPNAALLSRIAERGPTGLTGHGDDGGHDDADDKPRSKPKQKRNKPTLSCLECVERKTKCNRERPCLACVKRQSQCKYTAIANLLAESDRENGRGSARCVTKPPNKIRKTSTIASQSPREIDNGWPVIDQSLHRNSRSSSGDSPFLLSNVPYAKPSPSNVFGVGSQHPFSNYWTCAGGLPEVVSVMPSKQQADILIQKYFEVVDPVYPFIHRQTFYADHERFWRLTPDRRGETDAAFIALLYAMYALGTQFMPFSSYEERSQTAEFYCSAANQALRVYSYLNRTSMRAIQAMLLMAYFLMNDNHASDAYAWAGIHLRQAYAMRLHRDPDVVVPEASILEKQQRRKLWQAVFFQDTFLTVLLKLPPTATHSDVPVDSLTDEHELSSDGLDSYLLGTHSRVENLMSISVIAPQSLEPLLEPQPHHVLEPEVMKSDVTYLRCMWHLGNLVQENLSSPCSLSLPLANSLRHKDSLIAAFKRLYKSFPAHLTQLDYLTLQQKAPLHPRAVRQNLFLTSNYFHCLMLLHASENESAGVECNLKPALEAAHEAIWAFFKLWGFFEGEAGVWWVFQHRAFEESLLIAHLLAQQPVANATANAAAAVAAAATGSAAGANGTSAAVNGGGKGGVGGAAAGKAATGASGHSNTTTATPHHPPTSSLDPIYAKTKEDVSRMLEIMERYGSNLEMHKMRKEVLGEAFARIVV